MLITARQLSLKIGVTPQHVTKALAASKIKRVKKMRTLDKTPSGYEVRNDAYYYNEIDAMAVLQKNG